MYEIKASHLHKIVHWETERLPNGTGVTAGSVGATGVVLDGVVEVVVVSDVVASVVVVVVVVVVGVTIVVGVGVGVVVVVVVVVVVGLHDTGRGSHSYKRFS